MLINIKERLSVSGRLQVIRDGEIVFDNHNTITDNGFSVLLRTLTGTAPLATTGINQIRLGTGTVSNQQTAADLSSPRTNFIGRTELDVDDMSAQYDFFSPDSVLPNATYTEIGMYIGGILFSYVLLGPAIEKATKQNYLFRYILTLER